MAAEMPDFLLGGGGGVLGAIATGVALFLRAKFVEKQETKKAGRDTSVLDRPQQDWLRSFLEAMTEDRREMKELFRELTHEIRETNHALDLLGHRQTASEQALGRLESKTDNLLQRRSS